MSDILGKIWSNWEVVKLKGEGSFGKVYEIRRKDIGGEYSAALKVISIPQDKAQVDELRTEGLDDKTATSYFQGMMEELVKEFATLEKLKGNSNIVSYEDHEIVEHKDKIGWDIYIRMELLKPLSEKISEGMKVKDVLQLGIDICKALEVCQDVGIIHRDIKLENIFVSSRGDYKLGDFGIARTAEKTLSNMSKKGTYSYMAPEVFKGEPYNHTVDIYSLGIVLYRLLNGNRLPFMPEAPQPITFGDKEEALYRRLNGEALKPPAQMSGEFADIILKACSYYAKDRYQNARDMRNALEKVDLNKREKASNEEGFRRFECYSEENSVGDIKSNETDDWTEREKTELLLGTKENDNAELKEDVSDNIFKEKNNDSGKKKLWMIGVCAVSSIVGIFVLVMVIHSVVLKKNSYDTLMALVVSERIDESDERLPLMGDEKEEVNTEQAIFPSRMPMKELEEDTTEEIKEQSEENSSIPEKKPVKKPEQPSAQQEPSSEEQLAPAQESQPDSVPDKKEDDDKKEEDTKEDSSGEGEEGEDSSEEGEEGEDSSEEGEGGDSSEEGGEEGEASSEEGEGGDSSEEGGEEGEASSEEGGEGEEASSEEGEEGDSSEEGGEEGEDPSEEGEEGEASSEEGGEGEENSSEEKREGGFL